MKTSIQIPGTHNLLAALQMGETLQFNQHTLRLANEFGPEVLAGINSAGANYTGALTESYVKWWRTKMLNGEIIEVTAEPQPLKLDDEEAAAFIDSFFEAMRPPEPSEWARRALANRLATLLDGEWFNFYGVESADRALQVWREHYGLAKHRADNTAEYVGVRALNSMDFRAMHPEVVAGLPGALLKILGLDANLLKTILGESADVVVQRYAHGVATCDPLYESFENTGPDDDWRSLLSTNVTAARSAQ
jgi:hypothetical protein